MGASRSENLEVVQALLAKGAQVNAKLDNGMTALDLAEARGNAEVNAASIRAGANP
jgi:ankyrin repeat protein